MSIVPPARSMRVGADEASTPELYEVAGRAALGGTCTVHVIAVAGAGAARKRKVAGRILASIRFHFSWKAFRWREEETCLDAGGQRLRRCFCAVSLFDRRAAQPTRSP